MSALVILVVLGLLFVVPAPSWTRSEGVIWLPEKAQVRAGTDGFIVRVMVPVDSTVTRDQPLIEAEDPFLLAEESVLEAQLREFQARLNAVLSVDNHPYPLTFSICGRVGILYAK